MAGISSKALSFGEPENRKGFNGIEHTTDLDLNQYDAFYRTLDPQLGRFLQVDPKIESAEAWSPYSAMLDNPIRYADPLGDSTIPGAGFWRNVWEGVKDGGTSTVDFVKSLGTKEGWQNLGNSIAYAGDRMNPSSPTGIAKNVVAGQQIVEAVKNVPNMTKDDVGHAVGYGTEKIAEAVVISKGAGAVTKAVEGAQTQTVFRVFGGDAKAEGFSWTPKNPNSVSNFRDAAGLPSGGASGSTNTGQFVIEGTVKNKNIITQRAALPLDGNRGGLPEYIINPKNVIIKRVSGVNPQF